LTFAISSPDEFLFLKEKLSDKSRMLFYTPIAYATLTKHQREPL